MSRQLYFKSTFKRSSKCLSRSKSNIFRQCSFISIAYEKFLQTFYYIVSLVSSNGTPCHVHCFLCQIDQIFRPIEFYTSKERLKFLFSKYLRKKKKFHVKLLSKTEMKLWKKYSKREWNDIDIEYFEEEATTSWKRKIK